ncbi:DUF3492 domain-containing protein [Streptomyces cacaoi]|uniref:DUF3492 domain-containing protein n=1 Tax=Streptomyces cacaoi TaxID=1898 RepID=UPI00374987C3
MRVALLTEGGYPSARGASALWCDRLLRGLPGHEFEVYALSRSARQEDRARWQPLPPTVRRVRTAPLFGPPPAQTSARRTPGYGRRERARFREHFAALAEAVCAAGNGTGDGTGEGGERLTDRFAAGLYGLADLAAERGGLASELRSETAVRLLESACRAPGALRAAHAAGALDLLAVTERLERALRPLSLDWYGARGTDPGLAAADLCHAVGAGPAALPALVARRAFGVPLLITEYAEHGVRLREHYLRSAAGAGSTGDAAGPAGAAALAPGAVGAPVRALLASFQALLVRETYAQAQVVTPGTAHARRWQERCGARPAQLRTVHPGIDPAPFDAVGEQAGGRAVPRRAADAGPPTLVWVGRPAPGKDLTGLLQAFSLVREALPDAVLRLVELPPAPGAARCGTPDDAGEYGERCRALAARLFPGSPGRRSPVVFEEVRGPLPDARAHAYAAGDVVVLSSAAEGFPGCLVEAMLCARATVSTDVGAVCEVVGGTGLVVPPRNPRALADACAALLADPARAARLGAAARARALELFSVRQNTETFRGIYRELAAARPRRAPEPGSPLVRSAESRAPGRPGGGVRTAAPARASAGPPRRPGWARPDGPGPGSAGPRAGTGKEAKAG